MGVVFNSRRHGHKFNRPRDIASRRDKPGRNNSNRGFHAQHCRFDTDASQCNTFAPDAALESMMTDIAKKQPKHRAPIMPHRQPAGKIENGRVVFKFHDGRPIGPIPYDFTSDVETDEECGMPSHETEASWAKRHRVSKLPTNGISGNEGWHRTAVGLATNQTGIWPSERESYAGMPYKRVEFRMRGPDGLIHFVAARDPGAAPKRDRSWVDVAK